MPFKAGKDLGYTKAEIRGIEKFLKHLHNELGEYGLVIRTARGEEIQIPYLRRELEVEGSIDETVQDNQEVSKTIQSKNHINWNPYPTGYGRFMVPSWDIGLGSEIRDEHNEVQKFVYGSGPTQPTHGSGLQLGDEAECGEVDQGKDQRHMLLSEGGGLGGAPARSARVRQGVSPCKVGI